MNNKPVAWYKKDSNDYLIENIGQPDFQVQDFIDAGYIPLYTHQTEHDLGIAEAIGNGQVPLCAATAFERLTK